MEIEYVEELFESAGIQHPCDVDLLVFFHRHPRVLLTSEQLAARTGYDLKRVARSLDFLIERGLLRRRLNHARVARGYFFRADGGEDWVERLLRLGLTPDGRSLLIRRLRERASRAVGADADREGRVREAEHA
jgi:DNA-binding MarR family transcriptional regulator